MFLADWFPRNGCGPLRAGSNPMAFLSKEFFHRMGETGHAPSETATDVLDTLKEGRDTFLAGATE